MNYELAKQLKDAGFSQMGDGFALVLHDEKSFEDLDDQTMSVIPWCQYVYSPSKRNDVLYSPTLEELIDACGDDFRMLEHLVSSKKFICFIGDSSKYVEGSTPLEAVAHLWLALHTNASR